MPVFFGSTTLFPKTLILIHCSELLHGCGVFLTQPKFNIHRLLQFVSFPGLRANVCSDVIGDEHGQGVVGYFPFAVDQLDNASPPAMS